MTSSGRHFKTNALLWIGLGAFVLAVLFVNPFREAPIRDDWAYALTVQHLLATGHYQLHEWAAANMPFQVYCGGLFARLLGFSYSSLRIATLTLAFIGLIAFYYLAREHGLNHTQAGLLMLCLFASPLFLHFSFNFMTDVPFLACLIVALLFYTRAIRLLNYPLMILASIAATAAVLTRQFGIALTLGVFSHWAMNKNRRRQALFYIAGLLLPAIAGLWQLYAGTMTPNWTARGLRYMQFQYLADPGFMLANMLWRPLEILQYLALLFLPLVFLALIALIAEFKKRWLDTREIELGRLIVVLLGVVGAYAVTGIFYSRFADQLSLRIPYLAGSLDGFLSIPGFDLARGILTPATLIGAILLARIVLLRYCGGHSWEHLPPSERVLDHVTLFLLLLQLIYVQFMDEYLMVFLPFALVVLGRHLKEWLNRFRIATGMACFVVLAVSVAWTRSTLERSEAYWSGSEFVLSAGIPPEQIYGSWESVSYYRFPDYLDEVGDRAFNNIPDYDHVSDYFTRWLPKQKKGAQIWVTESLPFPEETWQILKTIPYEDIFLRHRNVYVVRRWVGQADYWFAGHLNDATIEAPGKDYVAVSFFRLDNSIRPVIYEHPPSRISFELKLPQRAFLCFGVALSPETWSPKKGDGVEFEILVQDANSSEKVFSKYIDPKQNVVDRRWHDEVVDLSKFGGKEVSLSFLTTPGYHGNDNFDWAGWSNPRIATNNEELNYEPVK